MLSSLFDELNVPATFFAEAETLLAVKDSAGCLDGFEVGVHGYAHEDLTMMDPICAEETISRAVEVVSDVTSKRPRSFRSPYMKSPGYLPALLSEKGFTVDSSKYSEGISCRPYPIGDMTEVPVCRAADGRSSYLWPMHEGRRSVESYFDLAGTVGEEGVFVLCDHSWHILEHCDGTLKRQSEIDESVERIRRVITGILEAGYVPVTMSQCTHLS